MSYIVPKEIPNRCGRCPCFHAEHPMYCQAVKADKNKRIYAPYGEGRPDWCPLIEIPRNASWYQYYQQALTAVDKLPPAQSEIVPCDYAKACNKVAMNRITSAVVYMEILEDFKEYGYVLVDMSENMPPANNSEIPNSSDTISRQAAIDICRAPHMRNADCSDFEMAIMMLPPAQPEPLQPWEVLVAQAVLPQPKMGKWIYHIDDLFPAESTMECNQCHAEQPLTCDDEFCPHCGAKMEVTT